MLEATLSGWKNWYSENRSEKYNIAYNIKETINEDTVLVRLWISQDGKAPKNAKKYSNKVWIKKGVKPANGLVIVNATGESPLLLTTKNSFLLKVNSLTKPYLWRCRNCGQLLKSNSPIIHCSTNARQLAHISQETTNWFNSFIENIQWKYFPHSEISKGQIGVIEDEEINKIANEAGRDLEKILKNSTLNSPKFIELYNYKTRYLRVSDLKDYKKFQMVIGKIAQWRKSKPKPNRNAPMGMIEIGHAFDELLQQTFNSISSEEWGLGERVWFNCEELGVTVSGTPDISFRGIPIETKTIKMFPSETNDANQQGIFTYKWKTNYSKQVALYLQGSDREWMFLLIISRESGQFTLVPVNDVAINEMRKEWLKWISNEKYATKLDEYKKLIAEEE